MFNNQMVNPIKDLIKPPFPIVFLWFSAYLSTTLTFGPQKLFFGLSAIRGEESRQHQVLGPSQGSSLQPLGTRDFLMEKWLGNVLFE